MKLKRSSLLFLTGILFIIIAALVGGPYLQRRTQLQSFAQLSPLTALAAEANPWTLAAEKVKEDRGEPVGKQAKVEIPAELRHYSDTRRFLAIQVAEVKERKVATPQDLIDLAGMLARGEFVQLQPVNENYILFGVGGNADQQPFTRYENGKSIPLYNEAELEVEYKRLASGQSTAENSIANLRKQVAALKPRRGSKRKRSSRGTTASEGSTLKQLQSQLTAAEQNLKLTRAAKALLDQQYGKAEARQRFFAAHESVEKLAAEKFSQSSGSNLADGLARRRLKVQLLSSLRPEAAKVLEEIASSYRETFDRPLPVTSLVRPDEYQHQLSKTNPNATRIETPPHSTGLAFDILYRYMTAAEQSHVMSHLARLKDEGRIEVLRENRDHYHVFAFVDGARPGEQFVAAVLGGTRSAKSADIPAERVAKARSGKSASRLSGKSSLAHHATKKSRAAKSTVVRNRRKPRR